MPRAVADLAARPLGRAVCLALAVVVVLASPAAAHRLKVFATAVGARIEGKAYFVGGAGAGDVSVRLADGAGTVLRQGRTADDGTFALETPYRTDLRVLVDAMDGHVAAFPIAASRLPPTLPPPPGEPAEIAAAPPPAAAAPQHGTPLPQDGAAIEAAVARQIAPLAQQVDALQSALRLQDVLGGLGYVVGIFGLFAFLKSRRRRPAGNR